MTDPRSPRLSRRRFLALSASAAALTAAPAAAQTRRADVHLGEDDGGAEPRSDPRAGALAPAPGPAVLQRLVEWGHDGKLEPALAESWTTSGDGRTWTFKLRRGVKFHNGRELVSEDVKYTYERILDPKVGSGGRGYLSAIDHIELPDAQTVRIVTKQPSASLPGRDGGWVVGDRRRRAVEKERSPAHDDGHRPFICRSGCRRATSRRAGTRTTGTRASRRRAIEIKVIPDEASIVAQLRTGNIHHALLEDNKNYLLVKDDKRLRAQRAAGSASTW